MPRRSGGLQGLKVVLDGLPYVGAEFLGAEERPVQATGLQFRLELLQRLELRRIHVVGVRRRGEVEVDGLAGSLSFFDLLCCSGGRRRGRTPQPAPEQSEHDIGLLHELLIDERLRVIPQHGNSSGLPPQRH